MFNLFKKKEAGGNLGYETDLHCHVLPGIDDGSPDTEQSVALIGEMQKWGIRRIIATPHIAEETFENTRETIQNAWDELHKELEGQDMDIDISFSAEYRMDDNFVKLFEKGELITLPDNYLLIENSFIQAFWNIEELIFQLQLKGYKPILAHPERYIYYHVKKDIYKKLHNTGCNFQVNLLSLSGYYGKGIKETALWLVQEGLVDFLGTDLHHAHHALAIGDYIGSKEYAKLTSRLNIKNDLLK